MAPFYLAVVIYVKNVPF